MCRPRIDRNVDRVLIEMSIKGTVSIDTPPLMPLVHMVPSISFIVSYLPIPLSSLSTSGPEHRPCQENDVHHKIKDEQQDTEQIQSIHQWMNAREKEGHYSLNLWISSSRFLLAARSEKSL